MHPGSRTKKINATVDDEIERRARKLCLVLSQLPGSELMALNVLYRQNADALYRSLSAGPVIDGDDERLKAFITSELASLGVGMLLRTRLAIEAEQAEAN